MFRLISAPILLVAACVSISAAHAGTPQRIHTGLTLKPGQWVFDQKVVMNGKLARNYSYTKNYCLDEAYPLDAAMQKALAANDDCVSRVLSSNSNSNSTGIEVEVSCPNSKTMGRAELINQDKFVYKGNTTISGSNAADTEISMTFKKASCSDMPVSEENPIEARLHAMQCRQVESHYAPMKARCAAMSGDSALGCQRQIQQMEEIKKTCK